MIIPKNVFIIVNGKRYVADKFPELKLKIIQIKSSMKTANLFDLQLTNQGSESLKVDAVELRFDNSSFFGDKTNSYRFYKEGLTVVGVSGARGKDDCDFELDPGFLRFTVSNADQYSWQQKNIFCGEQIGVVSNKQIGENILFGFVTCKDYFCRIIMNMEKDTDIHLSAIVDTDGIVIKPSGKIKLEKLMIATGNDVENLLEAYATETALQMKAVPSSEIPTGWCSFYFYYGQETENDILENARFFAKNRDTIPIDYIQIDDGWQKSRGNWLETNPQKYPHGMEWLAKKIKQLGIKPGIWVAPFLINEQTDIYQNHRDWLLRDTNGELMIMGSDYFLDTSHPEALKWLTECFKIMKDWGYTYFKLDFMMVETCNNAQYYDKNITRVQAYRQGLTTIRKAIGDDAFILGGTALMTPNVGLINGSRVTTDVTPFWSLKGCTPESPTIFNICRNMINRAYMHQKLWTNDPDCLIVRDAQQRGKYKDIPALTLDETHMLASAMIMSGGALFLGDRMEMLSEERLTIIYKVFALLNGIAAYPVDRMNGEIPQIWFKNGEGSPDNPHLLAIYNWDTTPNNICVTFEQLNLNLEQKYCFKDIWTEKEILTMEVNGCIKSILKPHTCKLISIQEIK
jgi:alpha-galactosidase